jgi:predicted double-glycine peptidase
VQTLEHIVLGRWIVEISSSSVGHRSTPGGAIDPAPAKNGGVLQRLAGARYAQALALAVFAALNLGCASYQGSAKNVEVASLANKGSWVIVPNFPKVMQSSNHDCGAAALAAVLAYWGRPTTPESVAEAEKKTGRQLRASDIERHAKNAGLSAFVFYGNMGDILYEVQRGRPVIVGVGKPYGENKALAHYEVVIGVEPKAKRVLLLDPAKGFQTNSYEGFGTEWAASKGVTIVTFLPQSKATSSR